MKTPLPKKLLIIVPFITGTLLVGGIPCAVAGTPVSLLAPGNGRDTTADAMLGQMDFHRGDLNFIDGHGLRTNSSIAGDIAIDTSVKPNRVFVVDRDNHRVLGWKNISTFSTHAAADIILGQPDPFSNACNYNGVTATSLCSPTGAAVDSAGNLYVADQGNHRVLFFNKPFSTDTTADDVFGQYGSLVTNFFNHTSLSANSLASPARVALDSSNNLYVTDSGNNRVLVFNSPAVITAKAGSGDTTADLVFGQFDAFNTGTCNNGGISKTSLCNPVDVAVDKDGNVYITDYNNHRVLEYNKPLISNTTADLVYGQLDNFTTGICNNGGLTNKSLCGPMSVIIDPVGVVYISERNNHRVLGYAVGKTTANKVLGQYKSFNAAICNNTAGGSQPPVSNKSLCNPDGLAMDTATGANSPKLFVYDTSNNRVLQYRPSKASKTDPTLVIKTGQAAKGVLGQYLLTTNFANALDGLGFGTSDLDVGTVAIDTSKTPNRIYVADYPNNRVLAWNDIAAFASHAPATLVIGQPNPYTNTANNGGVKNTTLNRPRGLAVDSAGNLFVADQENHRVLGYRSPFTTNTTADIVFGQSGVFTTNFCNQSGINNDGLCRPVGLATDSGNNLYVADYENHRVLVFNKPFATDTTADKVFGQDGNFTSRTCNLGGVTQNSLCHPHGVAVDSADNLYVTDPDNHRVLEFNSSPANTSADFVFGQTDNFTTQVCNNGGLNENSLCAPRFVATNSRGDVFIADTNNHRVLKYNKPLTTDRKADKVFGQNNLFTINGCRPISASTLCFPDGISVDSADNLYIVDSDRNRVLQFLKP